MSMDTDPAASVPVIMALIVLYIQWGWSLLSVDRLWSITDTSSLMSILYENEDIILGLLIIIFVVLIILRQIMVMTQENHPHQD